jgi:uncharacterized protein YbaP (TraB family)
LGSCAAKTRVGESKAALWKVQGDHNTVYLLGTIHVLSKQAYPLKPALERAFDDANQVVFKAVGKPVLGLETLRDQAEIFDRFNDEQNEQYLLSTLSGLPSYAKMIRQLVGAWKDGDVQLLDRLLNLDKLADPATQDVLFARRNSKWVPEIERFAHGDVNYLVIVGTGHLAGDDGVVAQLRRAGYSVQQLYAAYPPLQVILQSRCVWLSMRRKFFRP